MRKLASKPAASAGLARQQRSNLQLAKSVANVRYRLVVPKERRAPSLELGFELRRLREARGMRAADVAAALDMAESTLSRKESGYIRVSGRDLDRLLTIYEATEPERRRLRDLADRPAPVPTQRARRARTDGALPGVYERFIELEEAATDMSIYAAMIVPGLVQTPEYATAMIHNTPVPEEEFVRARIIARMARQGIFERQPSQLRIILDEPVLLRPVGGPHVMRRQMLRLIEASERPQVSIRVLPLSTGAHPAMTGHFTVLQMEDNVAHIFCDGLTGGVLRSKPEDVLRYRACFDQLTELAMTEQESVELFHITADRFRE